MLKSHPDVFFALKSHTLFDLGMCAASYET